MLEPEDATVHGLANHIGALLLGLDLLGGEEDLPDHARVTLRTLLEEARSAAALVAELQERSRADLDPPSSSPP